MGVSLDVQLWHGISGSALQNETKIKIYRYNTTLKDKNTALQKIQTTETKPNGQIYIETT